MASATALAIRACAEARGYETRAPPKAPPCVVGGVLKAMPKQFSFAVFVIASFVTVYGE